MYTVQAHVPRRTRRRVNLPHERIMVNDVGLGGFNIGKMFKRMVTFKKHSFDFKNILGAVGSVTSNVLTAGAGSILAGKQFGAHGNVAGFVGGALVPGVGLLPKKLTGMTASERLGSQISTAVVGTVGAAALLPAGTLTTLGSGAMKILGAGGTLLKGAGGLFGNLFGGGSGAGGGGTQPDIMMPTQIVPPQQIDSSLQQVDPNAASQFVASGGGANYGMQNVAYPTMPDASPGGMYAEADPSAQVPDVNTITSAQMIPQVPTDYTYYYVGGGLALAGLIYYISK